MRKLLGMAALAVGVLMALPAMANNCKSPARTEFALGQFMKYGGAAMNSATGLADRISYVQTLIGQDEGTVREYSASFSDAEREAFFAKTDAEANVRMAAVAALENAAKAAGVNPDALVWLHNHELALQVCDSTQMRLSETDQLPAIIHAAQAWKDDAVVAALLDAMPQACNDSMLDAYDGSYGMAEPGSDAAYRTCGMLVQKTSVKTSPYHFSVYHQVAEPTCELKVRLADLARGAAKVEPKPGL